MEDNPAVVRAQEVAEGADARRGDDLASGEFYLLVLGAFYQVPDLVAVRGEAAVVGLGVGADLLVAQRVDVVGVVADGGESASEVRVVDAVWEYRQIRKRGEAAEGLAEGIPRFCAEVLAESLGILDDGIGAQVGAVFRQVVGTFGEVFIADGRGLSGSTLVKHDDAVVLKRHVEPVRVRRRMGHARGLGTGPTLQEREVGQVLAAGARDDGGEDVDRPFIVGIVPVQRHVQGVVVDAEVRDVACCRHSYLAYACRRG